MLSTERERTALARFAAIAPLLAQGDPRPLSARIAEQADRQWPMPDGLLRQFSRRTIEGWHYAYQRAGIEALNSAFHKWVEEEYNNRPHSALSGLTPMERWLAGASVVRLLPTDGSVEHAFLLSDERTVRSDGTIVFNSRLFETDYALKGRKVQVRWRLSEPGRLYVYDEDRYVGVAKPLNRTLNARLPRRKLNHQGDQP